MKNMVAWMVATIVTIPLLGWYLFYITTVKITKKKVLSVRLASDWTSVLFMTAVYFIMYELWNRSFLWVILAVFFFTAFFFTWMHWRVSGDVHTRKLFKGIWRLNFILFLAFYFILSGYGLISRILG